MREKITGKIQHIPKDIYLNNSTIAYNLDFLIVLLPPRIHFSFVELQDVFFSFSFFFHSRVHLLLLLLFDILEVTHSYCVQYFLLFISLCAALEKVQFQLHTTPSESLFLSYFGHQFYHSLRQFVVTQACKWGVNATPLVPGMLSGRCTGYIPLQ